MTSTKNATITDIFLAKGLVDTLFFGRVPKDLYRFAPADCPHRADSPWEPVWYPYSRTDTKARRSADIEPKWADGSEWVTPGTGGLSLFDAPVTFGLPGICLRVPSGTNIPAGLAISKDAYRERYKATHYTIHPVFKMRKTHFYLMLKSFEMHAVSQ